MTTITASATGGYITLTITPTATVTGVTRTDANGSNVPLRVPAGTFPTAVPVTLIDWEASLAGNVTYWTIGTAAGSATTKASTTSPYLVTPLRPSQSLELEQVSDYSSGRTSLSTFHQVPDRHDPLVALGRLAMRTGTVDIFCPNLAAAMARENVLDMAGVLMLKSPDQPGLDMYFVANDVSKAPDETGPWMLSVAYTEILRPTSPITPTVWTFATLAASFASFANVSTAYEDFEGLSLNDQTGVNL